jgi:short-subunit dehydrogenase
MHTKRRMITNMLSMSQAVHPHASQTPRRGDTLATIGAVRTAVITGGSSGIGLAVARELARRGGWRLLLAARDPERLAAAAGELGATAVACDVTSDDDVAALVVAARSAGGCDLLVHSAGAPARRNVLEADLDVYRRSFAVNYLALVRVATAFWPLLEERRGRLVPVVSVAGTVALAPSAPYASAKSAALSWARSYGAAAREHGVAVTIVNPGPVPTPGFPQGALMRSRWGRLLVVDAERCAERLLAAADRRAPEVFIPQWWRLATALQGVAPGVTARVAARAWRAQPATAPEASPA